MTPDARLAATIELFDLVQGAARSGGAAADNLVRGYFRKRRFAGSKDRRSITANIYAILHDYEALAWRVGECGGEVSARALVIAWRVGDGEIPETEFTGQGYGAAPLDGDEKALAERLRALETPPPENAALNCPDWLGPALGARFGDGFAAAMGILNKRAPVTFRVNSLKISREEAIKELASGESDLAPTGCSPWGLTLAAEAGSMRGHPLVKNGALEVQGEASQIASLLVDARPGMQVLDLCAGAGGKSLTLAAAMENKGQIYAADINARRLGRLKDRYRRAGARNIQTVLLPGASGAARQTALNQCLDAMDRVVVDAPCSGTGTWRHNPELRLRADAEWLQQLRETQQALLGEAAGYVKSGGRLVYMTCSLLAEENEAQVESFLAAHQGWSLLPVDALWRETALGPAGHNLSHLDGALQLGPDMGGFFVAILKAP